MSTPSGHLDESLDNASFVAQMRPSLVKYFKRKTGSDRCHNAIRHLFLAIGNRALYCTGQSRSLSLRALRLQTSAVTGARCLTA